MLAQPIAFLRACLGSLFSGGPAYRRWMLLLVAFIALGGWGYSYQLREGLGVTAMTDQVSWGAYIANFTFLVGMAAAAVMLVIPAYIYHNKSLKEVVVYGELLAVSAIAMCLMFVLVDIGRLDRFWHMMPGLGKFNFPVSVLAWDVVVLNVYLILNATITIYVLYSKFIGRELNKRLYLPLVFIAIVWAFSIHTVTAFLYCGLPARPYWHAAILAPRFIASAFAAGPAFIYVVLQFISKYQGVEVREEAYRLLSQIITVAALINLFLLASELFTEFYNATSHVAAPKYLFFGLGGYNKLVPYIWTAVFIEIVAIVIYVVPRFNTNRRLVNIACGLTFIGVWTEKGMGLIIPGFVPSPIGEVTEYMPTFVEFSVCAGIWATGMFIFTCLVKVAAPVLEGRVKAPASEADPEPTKDPEPSSQEVAA